MSPYGVKDRIRAIVCELDHIRGTLDAEQLNHLADLIHQTSRVFFSGQGRSGLMVKAIAIRLMHIGINVYVAGESNTPAMEKNELLVAVSSSAKTTVTLSHIAAARKAGAKVVLVSSTPAPQIETDFHILIPARTEVATEQHAGSLFEQSLLIAGDAIAWRIQHLRGQTDADLNKRHANLQ
ncbi:SIS domain-containing protein [Sodalis sp. dw_96]|uniref:SIS domain-containing protein n=1 Tax=Sodalis sp. dw_96 TaxID=2719794 RepID=UPI001BD4A87A|nr:SIS domain-containing protein [Sodalis sp. dw_96]